MATLNIKDPEVHRMAHELAARRHTTATGAVREALREALAQGTRPEIDREGFRQRVREIQRAAAQIDEPFLTDDDLYDENGLPK